MDPGRPRARKDVETMARVEKNHPWLIKVKNGSTDWLDMFSIL